MSARPRRPRLMIAHPDTTDNPQALHELTAQLLDYVRQAAHQGSPAHQAERDIWQRILAVGRVALGQFFALQGTGDQGETLTLPDGNTRQRLPDLHPRRYVSIFGSFDLRRTVYGSREGQKIDFVPLDNRLQLPASDFSYVLQDWDPHSSSASASSRAFRVASTVSRTSPSRCWWTWSWST
jgi:hypothetical protein